MVGCERHDAKGPAVRGIVALLSVICLMSPTRAEARSEREGVVRWATGISAAEEHFRGIDKVLVVVVPAAALPSQVCEDVLAVELMSAQLEVISREKRGREERRQVIEADEAAKAQDEAVGDEEEESAKVGGKAQSADSPDKKVVDFLSVAKGTGAGALVTVTVLSDTVQRNVYDKESARVREVRTELLVRALSVTVVEVDSGKLLLAGFAEYGDGVPLLAAAREMGTALVKQLR